LCRLGGFQAQRVSISEPIATIVAAVIAAAAGIIGTYFAYVLPEKRKRPALLADFIDTIAKDVTEMTTMFEREEIPHVAGTRWIRRSNSSKLQRIKYHLPPRRWRR